MIVAEATIDRDGRIIVALGRHAGELQDRRPLSADAIGVPLSVRAVWITVPAVAGARPGTSSVVCIQGRASLTTRARQAGDYEPARRAIASYFTPVSAAEALLRS